MNKLANINEKIEGFDIHRITLGYTIICNVASLRSVIYLYIYTIQFAEFVGNEFNFHLYLLLILDLDNRSKGITLQSRLFELIRTYLSPNYKKIGIN